MFGFCNHDDELIETREMLSAFEQMVKAGVRKLDNFETRINPFKKALVSIVRCKKCGRVEHVVTHN